MTAKSPHPATETLSQSGNISTFEAMHHDLDEMFLSHQQALLNRDMHEAMRCLLKYERLLHLHMEHEERYLLPAFSAGRAGLDNPPGLPAEVYVLEHRKIRERLNDLKRRMRDLSQTADCSARNLIGVLDLECGFKQLVEHHNRRELNLLYPDSNTLIPHHDRTEMITQCRKEWNAAVAE
ncbi:MAG: hypothetical protein Kow0074_26140 [Candidatus Zixiibacteriota bacterium]